MLYNKIRNDNNFVPAFCPELDIVVWTVKAGSVEESALLSQRVFDRAAAQDFHLSPGVATGSVFSSGAWPDAKPDQTVTGLRSVSMKTEHKEEWLETIWERLQLAVQESF